VRRLFFRQNLSPEIQEVDHAFVPGARVQIPALQARIWVQFQPFDLTTCQLETVGPAFHAIIDPGCNARFCINEEEIGIGRQALKKCTHPVQDSSHRDASGQQQAHVPIILGMLLVHPNQAQLQEPMKLPLLGRYGIHCLPAGAGPPHPLLGMGAIWLAKLHLEIEWFEQEVKDDAGKIVVGSLSLYQTDQRAPSGGQPEMPSGQDSVPSRD
jgi:hypothetical protein